MKEKVNTCTSTEMSYKNFLLKRQKEKKIIIENNNYDKFNKNYDNIKNNNTEINEIDKD